MFLKLILTAQRLKRRRKDVEVEKQLAWEESKNKEARMKLKQRYIRWYLSVAKLFTCCRRFPRNSCMYRTCYNLQNEGTYENFTFKSILGFLGGFLLTYIFFMFFVLQLNFKLSTATIMCSIFGSILTIGLAFSYKVRCIVFLVLPQFFSKKGRQALLAYAYILAITGPAKNTLNNMSILGESLACGQEQLKSAVRQIIDVIKKPFYAIRDAIKAVVKAVKEIVVKIKEVLLSIKKIIMSLVKIIKAAFKFVANIVNVCNREVGTPFQRCIKVFEGAITDCNAKLGPLFSWLCNITYLGKAVCYIAKTVDFMCSIIDFIKDTVGMIVTKVKQFVRHIRVMFYVRIKFSHSFHFETNHSRSMNDITTGIVTEIKQRSSGMIKIFDFMSCAASLFFIFMVVKVIYYRHKFLTNERFDNKFITQDFRQIDLKRAQMGLETVLPLNHRERRLYIKSSSLRLVTQEISELSHSAMILLMTTLKLTTHMATDYSLWWIMTLIRYYGRFQSKIPTPNAPTLNIEGTGFLAALLRSIVAAFRPIGLNLEIDTIPCLPDPIPPDYDRYIQIATLLLLCWFLAVFEPYGLRFRHSVMCYYHPQRARERSIWLYNHILRNRSSFLKFARRQLRRKINGEKGITKVTFKEFLRSKLNCKLCHMILPSQEQAACLLCGEVFRESDHPIKCQTPNCPGIYCERCFNDLQNTCTVCLDPIQYGDLSDVSEEKGSTDQSQSTKKTKKKKKKKKKKRKKSGVSDNYETTTTEDEDTDHSDKKRLLDKKDKDSDYYSSPADVSSDYSYTYQDNKDISKAAEKPAKSNFVDVEKQNIPEHATMQDLQKAPYSTAESSNITELNTTPDLDHLQTPTHEERPKINLEEVGKPNISELQNSPHNPNREVFYSTPDSSVITELNTTPDLNRLQTPTSDLDQRQPLTRDSKQLQSTTGGSKQFQPPIVDSKLPQPPIQESKQLQPSSRDSKLPQPPIQDSKQLQPSTRDSKQLQPSTRDSKQLQPTTRDSEQLQPTSPDFNPRRSETRDSKRPQPPVPDFISRQPINQDSKQLQPSTRDSKQLQPSTRDSKQLQPTTRDSKPTSPDFNPRQSETRVSKRLQPPVPDFGSRQPITPDSKELRSLTRGSKQLQPPTRDSEHPQPASPDFNPRQLETLDSKRLQPPTRDSKHPLPPVPDLDSRQPTTRDSKRLQPPTQDSKHPPPPVPDFNSRQPTSRDSKQLQLLMEVSKKLQPSARDSKQLQPNARDPKPLQPPAPNFNSRQPTTRDSKRFQPATRDYKQPQPLMPGFDQRQPPARGSKHLQQPAQDSKQVQPPMEELKHLQPSPPPRRTETRDLKHPQPPIPDFDQHQPPTQDSKQLHPRQPPIRDSKHLPPPVSDLKSRQPPTRDSKNLQPPTQHSKQLQPPSTDLNRQPPTFFSQLQPPASDFSQLQRPIKSCKMSRIEEDQSPVSLDFSSSPITEEEGGGARVLYLNKTYNISAGSIPMKNLLYGRSRKRHGTFQRSPVQVYRMTAIHPDVPTLDLNFEGREEGQCTASTTSRCTKRPCNCRFFRDVVKFGSVSETRRSPDGSNSSTSQATTTSSSSLISSLNKMTRTDRGVPMETDRTYTPTSEAEDAKKRAKQFNKYRLHDSMEFDRIALTPKSTSSDTTSILDSDIHQNVRRRNIVSSSQVWYKDKVTEYYSHIKNKKHKPYFPPKPTQSVLKRFLKIFKGNKKNSIL